MEAKSNEIEENIDAMRRRHKYEKDVLQDSCDHKKAFGETVIEHIEVTKVVCKECGKVMDPLCYQELNT